MVSNLTNDNKQYKAVNIFFSRGLLALRKGETSFSCSSPFVSLTQGFAIGCVDCCAGGHNIDLDFEILNMKSRYGVPAAGRNNHGDIFHLSIEDVCH
jgi:hypothetical protein